MEKKQTQRESARLPIHVHLAGLLLAVVVFFSVFEPTLSLRYGPFVAFFAMVLSNIWRFKLGITETLLIGFLLWSWISQTWTNNPDRFDFHMLSVLSCAAVFLGIRQALSAGASIHLLYGAFVAGCLVGLYRTSIYANRTELVRDVAGRIVQAGDLNINSVAYSVVVATVLTIFFLHRHFSRSVGRPRIGAWQIAGIALIGLLVVGAVQTQTRGAHVSLVLVLLGLIISRFGRPVKVLAVVCLFVGISISAGWIDLLLELIDYGNRTMAGLSGRTELWAIARNLWSTHLFIGVGFGGVRALSTYGLPAHNMLLEMGSSLGLIGVFLFFGFVVSALRDRHGELPDSLRRLRQLLILLALVPIALSGTWEYSVVSWVGLALLSHPLVVQVPAPSKESTLGTGSTAREENPTRQRVPLRV